MKKDFFFTAKKTTALEIISNAINQNLNFEFRVIEISFFEIIIKGKLKLENTMTPELKEMISIKK